MAGLFQRAAQFLAKRTFSLLDYSGYSEGVPAYPERTFQTLAKEGYVENATAYACINAIAVACAGIGWKVYKKGKGVDGKRTPYETHKLLDLLKNPNGSQTGAEFTAAEICFLKINGTSFIVLTGFPVDTALPLTRPSQLLLPRPDLVRPIPNALGIPTKYRIGMSTDSGISDYDASRVIQRRHFHPLNPVYGLAPLEVAAKDVDVLNATTDFLYRLMKRNGRPDGVLISNGALNGEQYSRLKKQVDDQMNNSRKAGGWVLMEGIVKEIKEFAFKPSDMNLTPSEIRRVASVCSVFGVPPEIIGIAEAKTYSNYEQAVRSFYNECVLPEMDGIRDKRQTHLMPIFSDSDELDYDKDNIEALQEDRDKVWTRALAAEQGGEITNNEYRAMVGMPKSNDPLADVRMISMTRVPADDYTAASQVRADTTDPAADPNADPADPKATKAARSTRAIETLPMVRALSGPSLWRNFDTARIPLERHAAAMFQRQLLGDYAAAASALAASLAGTTTGAEAAITHALQARKASWELTLKTVYLSVGLHFAERVDAGLREQIRGFAAPETRAGSPSWTQHIATGLAKNSGRKIGYIGDTTRKKMMATVSEGYAAGEGADTIAAKIRKQAPVDVKPRSLTIARTEVMTASNMGSDAAARAFEVPLVKFWLATADDRTREAHAEADGQQREMDDTFTVGGEEMLYPGDDTNGAEAAEIINCRCAVTYEVKE